MKLGLQKYHDTSFSRSGANQMWILKVLLGTFILLMVVTASKHLIYLPYIQPHKQIQSRSTEKYGVNPGAREG